ncbi:DNA/RNA non-specific endonuclease [Methylocystis parvus]|uniref:DNA/RNA endonuclease n=1 Tax=Methylocystis parvus TaxID=134 RepID=A0A6B8M3I9_9HYPH|nr:DNA/RNA non-specific endonuclease [Methylocystis parvus]QGM96915.1 DNA/RNA endonuclease [Methylocystis parvus]WBJ99199.1 DNA/RNA non-specific endonuclease [Methylocystis parvus OBBP]
MDRDKIDQGALDAFHNLVESTREKRREARRLVATGRWREIEDDVSRAVAYFSKRAPRAAGAEAARGSLDFQPVSFLTTGALARNAVAYVESPLNGATATGFLISPRLFLTNHHVLESDAHARGALITFRREFENGHFVATTVFKLDPDRFFISSPDNDLDFALVAVGERTAGAETLDAFSYCVLSNKPDKHVKGMSVNIIQHPLGMHKMVTVRNNILQERTARSLLYETDTEHGSSGAPVFNDEWELIALHHWGEPALALGDSDLINRNLQVNEGVRISALYERFDQILPTLEGEKRTLLAEALDFAKNAPAAPTEKKLGGPAPAPAAESLSSSGAVMPAANPQPAAVEAVRAAAGELKIVVPIEISVRIGGAGVAGLAAGGLAPAPLAPAEQKQLLRAAEALRIDPDYASRSGYREDFIPGHTVPLPSLSAKLLKQIAPLRAGEADAESGLLKYEHFSVVINKTKRIAIYTATNIDGATYLDVNRSTGQVAAAEADQWFKDPRVSAGFVLDQTFYSDWSHIFDRGHLTRRSDPTWGDADTAERANADTFHFTNCSPQHFRFNQSAKFWQGVERFVLENGVLADDARKPLCVIQGPIYDEKIDRTADDVQIPSSFFKIVVWKGKSGLKSVGLVVDQFNLLDETRKNLGGPKDLASVDVQHWRVSVQSIEKRTGLNFGDAMRAADTINLAGQPQVGAEALIRVTKFSDLLPPVLE